MGKSTEKNIGREIDSGIATAITLALTAAGSQMDKIEVGAAMGLVGSISYLSAIEADRATRDIVNGSQGSQRIWDRWRARISGWITPTALGTAIGAGAAGFLGNSGIEGAYIGAGAGFLAGAIAEPFVFRHKMNSYQEQLAHLPTQPELNATSPRSPMQAA